MAARYHTSRFLRCEKGTIRNIIKNLAGLMIHPGFCCKTCQGIIMEGMKGSEITIEVMRMAGSLRLSARWRGHEVGYVDCVLHEKWMLLGDIRVKDVCLLPFHAPLHYMHKIGLPYIIKRDCRRIGVGAILIRQVKEEAIAAGMEYVRGAVTESVLNRCPFVLGWYERRGFVVSDPDADCLKGAVKMIKWWCPVCSLEAG